MWLLFNLLTFHFAGTFDSISFTLTTKVYLHLSLFLTGLESCDILYWMDFSFLEMEFLFWLRTWHGTGCSIKPVFPYFILYGITWIWCRFDRLGYCSLVLMFIATNKHIRDWLEKYAEHFDWRFHFFTYFLVG